MRVRVSSAAKADLASALRWYRQHRPGLDLRFLQAFDSSLEAIQQHPQSAPLSKGACAGTCFAASRTPSSISPSWTRSSSWLACTGRELRTAGLAAGPPNKALQLTALRPGQSQPRGLHSILVTGAAPRSHRAAAERPAR